MRNEAIKFEAIPGHLDERNRIIRQIRRRLRKEGRTILNLKGADARRLAGAKKATVTRQRRRERKFYQLAERITAGLAIGPRQSCAICGRHLIDHESIQRGIGPECWQDILIILERREYIDSQRSLAPQSR